MNEQLQAGDVVVLKSGGAPMTIESIDILGTFTAAYVTWMTPDANLRRAQIILVSLQKAV